MPVSKLYVEGKLDLKVLSATLALLPNNPQISRKGSKDDLPHLVRRERLDAPGTAVVYLRDRDFDFEPVLPISEEPVEIRSAGELHGYRWQRHEIENYLLTPKLVELCFGVPATDTEAALLAAADRIRDYQAARWTVGQTRSLVKGGGLQTRPDRLRDYQLPANLSSSAVAEWAKNSVAEKLTAYSKAMDVATIQQRFSDYQAKFSTLRASEVLIWFSGKDLLTAMDQWRQRAELKSPNPENFISKLMLWLESGNGQLFLDCVPEVQALAIKLTV